MSSTTLMKMVVLLLCINIFLYVGGVRVIDTNQDFMSRFVSPTSNNSIEGSQFFNTSEQLRISSNEGIGEDIKNFIDSLNAIKQFIIFLVNILITPIGLFGTMPEMFGLIIGLPITVIGIIGLIYLIRSGG